MPATTWQARVHVFNYFTCLLDRGGSIAATFDESIINHKYIEEIKTILDNFMSKPYIQEIYTMDKEETPLLYTMGIKNDFKTVKILSSEVLKEE